MAAAGHPNGLKNLDFVVRDIASFKLWAVAIQAMLKENLNVETNLRVVQTSQWFEEAGSGNFDLAISAIVSSLMDPSDHFTPWYGTAGPRSAGGPSRGGRSLQDDPGGSRGDHEGPGVLRLAAGAVRPMASRHRQRPARQVVLPWRHRP